MCHVLCGHTLARFMFSAGTFWLASHVRLARPPLWDPQAFEKNIIKPMKIDTSGGLPNEVCLDVPCSLRAHFGSLLVWALLALRGCGLGISDRHERHTPSKSASNPMTRTLPYGLTGGIGADRTGPCCTVSDLTVSMHVPHVLCGHILARFMFSAGKDGLTSHVSLARSPLWDSPAFEKYYKTNRKIHIWHNFRRVVSGCAMFSAGTFWLA